MDAGLLLLRLAVGGALLIQGAGKLRPRNRAGVAGYFGGLGFEPAGFSATAAGVSEVFAGLSLLLGAVTPLGVAAAVGVLLAAVVVNGANGWSAGKGGAEYPTVLLVTAAVAAFTGPGEWSVDAAVGIDAAGVRWGIGAVALAVVASVPVLARRSAVLRRRAAADAGQADPMLKAAA